ncbi:hypothetical protein KGP36_03250 [Patescibacteria group bacterium]|nr:hypothetical protein [Patescibacteria group bacterium]
MTKRIVLLAAFLFALPAWAGTYYANFSTGNNSNSGTSQASPWKTFPGMNTSASCAGGNPTYTPTAGDKFILSGNVTWPAACFEWSWTWSGTSASPIYIGVCSSTDSASPCFGGTSWPSTGWTQPVFDLNYTKAQNTTPDTYRQDVIYETGNYVIFDNFQELHANVPAASASIAGQVGVGLYAYNTTGVTLENAKFTDWVSTDSATVGSTTYYYTAGGMYGVNVVNNVTVSDANGYASVGGTRYNQGFGGACKNCGEIKNSTFHDVWGACFTPLTSCHDNNLYNVYQGTPTSGSATSVANLLGVHTLVIEDTNPCGGSTSSGGSKIYNNWIHDNLAGVNIFVKFNSFVYNNVLAHNGNNDGIRFCLPGSSYNTSSAVGYVYNNTIDCSNGLICVGGGSPDVFNGTLIVRNNVLISGSATIGLNGSGYATVATLTQDHNRSGPSPGMSSAEASQYGFVYANLYKPSLSDPNTVGQGVNLSGSCGGNFVALCQDTSGAPWFGGAYINRGSSWDLGAFMAQGGGGSTGPPSAAITSPSAGTVTGSVSFTATCTPQGSATVSTIQLYIDGFPFGAAGTASPYTLSWDTNTASNARSHALTAVCTDSNSQTGSAGPVNATPANTHANGGFVSDSVWAPGIPNISFTTQTTGSETYNYCITPNSTTNNDNETGLSQALPTGYGDFATIIAIRAGGYIQAYNNGVGYTTDAGPTAYPVVTGTNYCFAMTPDLGSGTYTVAETSPSAVTIATNFQFRASASSLSYLSAYATNNSTPDTVVVNSFAIAGSAVLSFNPGNLNFGNVTNTTTSMLTDAVTVASGPATGVSAVVAGTGFSLDASSTCSTSISAACNYVVDFTPPSTGSYSGTLTVTSSATGSPQVFTLSGSGVAATPPTLTFSPTSNIDFGGVQIHTSSSVQTITVGVVNGPATASSIVIGGLNAKDFKIVSNSATDCRASMVDGCQIAVQTTPQANGIEIGSIVFTSNGNLSPYTINLQVNSVNTQKPAPTGSL